MNVIIYSTKTCGYCTRAKAWFDNNNILYDEIILDNQEAILKFKEDCPSKTTVPQIIINGELIGGYGDLIEKQDYVLTILNG